MKVSIQGQVVMLIDEQGTTITISTDQLLEMFRLLCIAVKEDDGLLFETLEFTV